VKVNGVARTVTAVVVSGNTIELTLASAATRTDTLTVGYTAPTPNDATTNLAVQDVLGNDSLTVSNFAVTNGFSDSVRPAIVSATTNRYGTKVILTYDEDLNSTTAGTGRFTVNAGSSSTTVSAVAVVGRTVELTLTNPVLQGQTVTVDYSAPTDDSTPGNAAIQDVVGNDAVSLTGQAVTNITDTTAPVFASAKTNYPGTKVILTYGEALGATTAAAGAFTVKVTRLLRF